MREVLLGSLQVGDAFRFARRSSKWVVLSTNWEDGTFIIQCWGKNLAGQQIEMDQHQPMIVLQ